MTDLLKGKIAAFQRRVLGHYERFGRDFPWRRTRNPYRIWVSEVMLQQTQTDRVRKKYGAFLKRFPSISSLADASPASVVQAWSGLGYNRRALNLRRAARIVQTRWKGRLPRTIADLRGLPGIGQYTAAAIACFAWEQPSVFIETNIRTVFLHEFFPAEERIGDEQLKPIIEQTLYVEDPRRWYYALMDYGVYLKKQHPGIGQRSKHYVRQSPFRGSRREMRGRVLECLSQRPRATLAKLSKVAGVKQTEVLPIVEALCSEGFMQRIGKSYQLIHEEDV